MQQKGIGAAGETARLRPRLDDRAAPSCRARLDPSIRPVPSQAAAPGCDGASPFGRHRRRAGRSCRPPAAPNIPSTTWTRRSRPPGRGSDRRRSACGRAGHRPGPAESAPGRPRSPARTAAIPPRTSNTLRRSGMAPRRRPAAWLRRLRSPQARSLPVARGSPGRVAPPRKVVPARKIEKPPPKGRPQRSLKGMQRRHRRGYTAAMLPTAIFPVRRSSSVSKETF